MIVSGGLYHEVCEYPSWNAVYGSGGRAAAVLAKLSDFVELHTYSAQSTEITTQLYGHEKVRLHLVPSTTQIAFAYLHPLSKPSIAPTFLPQHSPIQVRGDAVVRFGFLEGEAIVTASHAVYDPQTSNAPKMFSANGSVADKLAIVLNENELRALGNSADIIQAAKNVFEAEHAEFIAAKRGVNGCAVFYRDGRIDHVPAYRSNSVFKIGTGDVFTATAAFYWAREGMSPTDAADLASRAVARYAQSKLLPDRSPHSIDLSPVTPNRLGRVVILGSPDALQDRWLIEEARWCIRELGLTAICPDLGDEFPIDDFAPTAALVLARDTDFEQTRSFALVSERSMPTLVFSHRALTVDCSAEQVHEFASAIYRVCWLATEATPNSRP